MYKVTSYPHGLFSWADNISDDPETAKQFYVDVMGWDYEDLPMGEGMHYTMFKQDGENVAGLGPKPPNAPAEMPSTWNAYISVDDVDALVDKVAELGGTVVAPPFDIFDSGRMMTIQDPTGAMVGLWQAKNHIGSGLVNTPGAFTWHELYTKDIPAAKKFYSELLGWTIEASEQMAGYNLITNGNGRMNGGVMELTPEMGEMPPHWATYFNVDDLDAKVAKVEASGGTVVGRMEPSVGPLAIVNDPAGASFILIQAHEYDKSWEAEA